MKWFGESWGAPVCTPENHAPKPQERCAACGMHFQDSDRGVILPFLGGPEDPPELPYHHRCLMRALGLDEGSNHP